MWQHVMYVTKESKFYEIIPVLIFTINIYYVKGEKVGEKEKEDEKMEIKNKIDIINIT